MKILMTLMQLDIGGAETHVVELSRALAARGHEVLIASNGGAYVPELEQAGIRHFQIPLHRHDRMLRALRLLRALIRREQPDLVHAHARIPAFLCGLLQKRMGFPLITSAHWVFRTSPLLRKMTNWGDRTMAVSPDIQAYLRREYQVPEDQIHVTINGINIQRFAPGPENTALRAQLGLGSGPVVGAVGRLDEDRAMTAEALIRLTPRLLAQFPDAQVLIVGGGTREAELRLLAEQVNAAGRSAVIMTGPRTDIADLLPLMTVFAGASRAALEAMAAGLPVVLSGNEGYLGTLRPEVLEAAVSTNFCFRGAPLLTEDALLADISAALSLPEDRRRALGAYGRQVVQRSYSVDRMAEDHLRAYDRLLHGPKPLRAAVSGYYGYGNLGDDSLLLAISRQLSRMDPPVRLTVLSRHPEETRRRYGLPSVGRFSPFGIWRALRRSDFLISGGGTLLQDRTSARSLWYYLSVIRLAQRLRKPVFLWANGIGPLDRPAGRRRVVRCVERCDAVTLRDADSLAELRAMGVTRTDIAVTADPALALEAAGHSRQLLTDLGVPADTPLLGISVRQAAGMERSIDAFAALCDRLSRETGRYILFLIMQAPGDLEMSRRIRARMKAPTTFVETPGDPAAMLGVIGQLDALLSMRLHTILFAAKQRIPVAGCVYDPKVEALLKQLDMPSCGTPEALDAESAFRTVQGLLDRRGEAVRTLEARAGAMEERIDTTPAQLRDMLERLRLIP